MRTLMRGGTPGLAAGRGKPGPVSRREFRHAKPWGDACCWGETLKETDDTA